jgi:hypothetical protein
MCRHAKNLPVSLGGALKVAPVAIRAEAAFTVKETTRISV